MPELPTQRIPPDALRYVARTPGPQPSPRAEMAHLPVFALFLLWTVGTGVLLVTTPQLPKFWGWTDGVVYVLAAATLLVSLARRLPVQSIVGCALVMLSVPAMLVTIGAKTGLPFGKFSFTDAFGPKVVGLLGWPIPFLWMAALLSSRGVAKMILRPWRRNRRYGYLLLGLSTLLVLLLVFALEPFATRVRSHWVWSQTQVKLNWYGTPWTNFLGWLFGVVFTLVFATPWLVVKRPSGPQHDYHALGTWLVLITLFTLGNALRGLWGAVALGAVAGVPVAVLAYLWGRPAPPPTGPSPGKTPEPPAPTPPNRVAPA